MNMQSRSDSYAAAGVDITAGYRAVELMKTHIAKTMTAGALSDIRWMSMIWPDFLWVWWIRRRCLTKPPSSPEM